jgi:hypothetical protein
MLIVEPVNDNLIQLLIPPLIAPPLKFPDPQLKFTIVDAPPVPVTINVDGETTGICPASIPPGDSIVYVADVVTFNVTVADAPPPAYAEMAVAFVAPPVTVAAVLLAIAVTVPKLVPSDFLTTAPIANSVKNSVPNPVNAVAVVVIVPVNVNKPKTLLTFIIMPVVVFGIEMLLTFKTAVSADVGNAVVPAEPACVQFVETFHAPFAAPV